MIRVHFNNVITHKYGNMTLEIVSNSYVALTSCVTVNNGPAFNILIMQ